MCTVMRRMPGLYLYQHSDYQGQVTLVEAGDHALERIQVASIRVADGYSALLEDDCKGRELIVQDRPTVRLRCISVRVSYLTLPTAPPALDQSIPKRIFQTHSVRTPHMPSWQQHNPDYTHEFYDDAQCAEFLHAYFVPQVAAAYCQLAPGAARADMWRYCVLYIHGGVYVDADCCCASPLPAWLPASASLVVVQDHSSQPVTDVFQGFLVSTPRHRLFQLAIEQVMDNVRARRHMHHIFELCGPKCLGQCLNRLHGRPRDATWGIADTTSDMLVLRHQRSCEPMPTPGSGPDSIWHHQHKVADCQLLIPRSTTPHQQQTCFILAKVT
jgi:hypothetical protein